MTFGALVLVVLAWMRAGFAATVSIGPIQWSVVGFLGLFGGCPHVLVVVVRLGANDADAGRHLGDNQSDCVRDLRGLCN